MSRPKSSVAMSSDIPCVLWMANAHARCSGAGLVRTPNTAWCFPWLQFAKLLLYLIRAVAFSQCSPISKRTPNLLKHAAEHAAETPTAFF